MKSEVDYLPYILNEDQLIARRVCNYLLTTGRRYTDRCELVEMCVGKLNATSVASLRLNPDTAASVW